MISTQFAWNAVASGSLYALVAVGFGVTYNLSHFFNMAHGVVFLVGGYAGYLALGVWGLPLASALAISPVAAGFTGWGLQRTLFRRLTASQAPALAVFLASLGVLTAFTGVVAALFGNEILVLHPGPLPVVELPGGRVTIAQLAALGLALGAFAGLGLLLWRTQPGRYVRAVADDRNLAMASGVPVDRVLQGVFFGGSALAGGAGLLVGLEQALAPTAGLTAVLWAIVASIVGGPGSFSGPLAGAFVLGVVESLAVVVFPGEWKTTIVFSTVIALFLFRSAIGRAHRPAS